MGRNLLGAGLFGAGVYRGDADVFRAVIRAGLGAAGNFQKDGEMIAKQRIVLAQMIREGFGVEDVAVKLRANVSDVRSVVSYWRASGQLSRMFSIELMRRRNNKRKPVCK